MCSSDLPWGILIGGEELHNNHHTYPNSSKLSRRWYEVDIGWGYIRLFQFFRLANPKGFRPIAHYVPGKQEVDVETVQAITNSRFDIMRQYRKRVMEPVLRQQKAVMDEEIRPRYRSLKRLLSREVTLIKPKEKEHLEIALESNAVLRQIYEKSNELQELWRLLMHVDRFMDVKTGRNIYRGGHYKRLMDLKRSSIKFTTSSTATPERMKFSNKSPVCSMNRCTRGNKRAGNSPAR